MQSKIVGATMPVLELTMSRGEAVVAEGGDVAWYSPGFEIDTKTGHGGRGFLGGLKRMLGGGSLFLSRYTAMVDGGLLAFGASLPGQIRELTIDPADAFMIQSSAYVASTGDVEVSVGLQKKLGAGIFGGAGLVLQRLSGNGTAWVQLSGEVLEYTLGAGESMLVHPGHLAMFRAEMDLQFATVKGIRNKFFGDSLFMAQIHGPGVVWLQSMTVDKLAAALQPYLATGSDDKSSFDFGSD